MRLTIIFFLAIMIYSCKNDKKTVNESKILDKAVLNGFISKELDFYISEYPIQDKNSYFYCIIFKENSFSFMRVGFMLAEEEKTELKGLFYYRDSIPVLIYDYKNVKNSSFYKNSFKDSFKDSLRIKFDSLYLNDSLDESFPPIWNYKIFENQALLIEKDTVWLKWE